MKIIALAFASVLLVSPAFAQSIPSIGPALLNQTNVSNVPLIVSGAQSAGTAAGITLLDIGTVKQIDAFNQPGPGGSPGLASTLQFNISGLLNSLK